MDNRARRHGLSNDLAIATRVAGLPKTKRTARKVWQERELAELLLTFPLFSVTFGSLEAYSNV